MRFWTAHLRPGRAPVLVREGFSLGAFLFGPLWLLGHAAWIPGLIALALWVVVLVLAPGPLDAVLALALMAAQGMFGRDLLRWSLARHGYLLAHVVAARDEDAALGRLLHRRPDLGPGVAGEFG